MNSKYIGHDSQLYGVEEHRLVGGKGDGMRLFQIKNGKGLELTVSADRGADISRLSYQGFNFGYFSPTGYVAPSYYDPQGTGFLKSFTAGFLTTCGLRAVGAPCIDEGEVLPLHGTVSHIPAESIYYEMDDEVIRLHATINDSQMFSEKLMLNRTIHCSKTSNHLLISDRIKNNGYQKSPLMFLYHFNIGYPLLTEDAIVYIPSDQVIPRNDHAVKSLDEWDRIHEPVKGFEEQCYYHQFNEFGLAAVFNPKIQKGIAIYFDPRYLDYFVQWKMMGEKDYVLGLEPGNCHPDGRDVMRKEGRLKFIEPDQEISYQVEILIVENSEQWQDLVNNYKK